MNSVIFTVCQRPYYLRESLEHWSKVRGINDWRLIFMIEPTRVVNEQVKVIDDFSHSNKQLIFNKERLGVLGNPWHGFEKSFNSGSHFTVLAEEDILVSEDVLEYFTFCIKEKTSDPEILTVCSNLRQKEFEEDREHEILSDIRFDPLIWGTWKDRWDNVIRDSWDHDYSTGDGNQGAGWDWNLNTRIMPSKGLKSLFPVNARSQHIGRLEGTHCTPNFYEETTSPSFRMGREKGQFYFS